MENTHADLGNRPVKRIQCWSGPRNISTALMYSFRQRPDTTVVDEPLYAHYLMVSGREHPGREDVLRSQDSDAATVIRDVILGPCPTPVLYIKQMAHHLRGIDRSHLAETENIILTRNPRAMLASVSVHMPHCDLSDTGLIESVELLDAVLAEGGNPVVIDSQDLLRDPAAVLSIVCDRLGIEFDESMLSWPKGPKPEDGAWAEFWYHRVRESTGFGPFEPSNRAMPDSLSDVLAEATPLYQRLSSYAIC